MLNASDFPAPDIGEAYLTSQEETELGEWAAWGLRPPVKSAHEICAELSRLFAATGPSVLAVDQIDTLIAQSASGADLRLEADRTVVTNEPVITGTSVPEQDLLIEEIGNGLMEARQVMRRTLIVVACFSTTWELIRQRAVASVADRFLHARQLGRVP
jgi:hypothetical protein